MGTDCRAIAKLKDGTYRLRTLDRYYVFSDYVVEHESLFDECESPHEIGKDSVFRCTNKFDLLSGIRWCKQRKRVLDILKSGLIENKDDVDIAYHLHWVIQLESFLYLIQKLKITDDVVEWVGVFADCDITYEEVVFDTDEKLLIEI